MSNPPQRNYTLKEAAGVIRVSLNTLKRLIKDGWISVKRLPGTRVDVIAVEEVDRYLAIGDAPAPKKTATVTPPVDKPGPYKRIRW